MALNDLYRVTLVQVWDSDAPVSFNVFYYKEIVEDPSLNHSDHLANSFRDVVDTAIRAMQAAIVSTININVENLTPSTDNTFLSFPAGSRPGAVADPALPPYCNYAFRLNRNSSAVRNGAKRFWGVPETLQDNGVVTAGAVTGLTAIATAVNATLGTVGASSLYQPRIFRAGRPSKTIPAKTIPAMLQADFDVASVSFTEVSSQNSRKFKAGV